MSGSFTETFMLAFAAGLVFALVYEVLRLIRIIFPIRAVIFVCDVLFFVLAGFAVIKLSVSLGNYVRGCIVFGFGAGIFAYITTIGRLLNLVENAVAGAVRSVLGAVFGFFGRICRKCFGLIAQMSSTLFGKIAKICSGISKKHNRGLKKDTHLVYNKESTKENSGGSESGHVIIAKVRKGVNT